jgi:hypothetical protein
VHLDTLSFDACLAADPPSRICIALQSSSEDVARGIAWFQAGDLDGGGFRFYMGRQVEGSWGYWFGTQQQVDILQVLPGEVLVCGRGAPVELHETPEFVSAVVASADHLSALTAEEFVLARPGQFEAGGVIGEGFYRISAPVAGWIDAASITSAEYGDCLLHDELRGDRG